MRLLPRFISGLVATAAATALFPLASQAADPAPPAAPHQPITMIMGFNAGSGVDVIGRVAQEPLGKILGQPVIIDYKSGAAGNIGSEFVARAKPDGYHLLRHRRHPSTAMPRSTRNCRSTWKPTLCRRHRWWTWPMC
jgi:tripartite-type tricarboxylate transporter receptor subunit TctC